jgi:transcription antitermination factor NusB
MGVGAVLRLPHERIEISRVQADISAAVKRSLRRAMAVGKRRTAREMAVQMLYQNDLGGSTLPQIFNTFDVAEYVVQEAPEGSGSGGAGEAGEIGEAPKPRRPGPGTPEERVDYAKRRKRVDDAFLYAQTLVRGTVDHREQIDEMIRGQADNWRLERMPAVDRNILRLAVYEMLFEMDIPKLVVVDEAIELAKKFGSEQSGRFVNGLLDGLLKQHTFPGSLT